MSNKRQGLLILYEHLGSLPGFDWACDAHLFSFLCLCFVCLRPVSCVPNVAIAHSLSLRQNSVAINQCIMATMKLPKFSLVISSNALSKE
jgi:hypothetical protein